jgi:NAD-dependent dihydropyrimidine dehydrogenase PreA subunit
MAIESLDKDMCTGCKICVDVCPEDVLRLEDAEKKAYIAYPEDCVACYVCEWFCPVGCIVVSKDPARLAPAEY